MTPFRNTDRFLFLGKSQCGIPVNGQINRVAIANCPRPNRNRMYVTMIDKWGIEL